MVSPRCFPPHTLSRVAWPAESPDGPDLRPVAIGSPTNLKLQFEVKKNDDGSYAEHKAKCVLSGHPRFLVEGIHYPASYALSPDNSTIIFACALALTKGWKRDCFSMSAYLQATGKQHECHDILLEYPEGLGGIDENGETYVALLKSAVIGHPDTAGCWNETMNGWIECRILAIPVQKTTTLATL